VYDLPVQAAAAALVRLGATLHPVSLPTTHMGLAAYYAISSAEAASNLARYDGVRYGHRASMDDESGVKYTGPQGGLQELYKRSRGEGFGDEVQRRLLAGALVLSSEERGAFYDAA